MKHELFPLDELPRGTMRSVVVGGTPMAVIRTDDDQLHALRDRCPHHGAPLAGGRLEPTIVADGVGGYAAGAGFIVRCPWHGYEFDVAGGHCPADPGGMRVRHYAVTVEDGVVVVER